METSLLINTLKNPYFYIGGIVALLCTVLFYALRQRNNTLHKKQAITRCIKFARKLEVAKENDEELEKLRQSIDKSNYNTLIYRNLVVYVGVLLSIYGYSEPRMINIRKLAAELFGSNTIWNARYLAAELLLASSLKFLYNTEGGAKVPFHDIIDKNPNYQNKYGFYADSAVLDLAILLSDSLYDDDATNENIWNRNGNGFLK